MQLCPLRSDGIGRVGWGFFQIRNFEMLAARDGSRIWGRTAGLLAAILVLSGAPAASIRAQQPLHDPNLPSVKPQALQQLSETQIRQQIIQQSQAPYPGRCVCPYQTQDTNGRSCKGRHEVIRKPPQPICYPHQVTRAMMDDWQRLHSNQ
jgi:hypothetical protein